LPIDTRIPSNNCVGY